MQDTGHYYVLNHLVQFTGLTDRTLRNYIASGILQGEKINGMWRFTLEQIEAFLAHPAVRPSILAKHHSLVYDFLLNMKKPVPDMCVILDIPHANHKDAAEFLCCRINQSKNSSLRFSFHGENEHARIILTGDQAAVMQLLNEYCTVYPVV